MKTSVPGLTESFRQPRRTSAPGGPASTIQLSTVPSSFVTSTCIQACGLIHSIFVMTPCSRTGFVASNSAEKA